MRLLLCIGIPIPAASIHVAHQLELDKVIEN